MKTFNYLSGSTKNVPEPAAPSNQPKTPAQDPTKLSPGGIIMAIESEVLARIKENDSNLIDLNLSQKNLTSQDIRDLVTALEKNTYLTKLNLYANKIDDEGAELLAKNTRLVALNLAANHISKTGVDALANSPTITWLDLSYNQLTDQDTAAIFKNTLLTTLILKDNLIGAGEPNIIPPNTSLNYLDLTDNFIGEASITVIARNAACTTLILTGNSIGDRGAIALAGNKTIINLTLRHCRITAYGAKELAKNTTLRNIDISYNRIRSDGVEAFAKSTTLVQLIAAANQVDNRGAGSFAGNKTLTHLDLSFNQISDIGTIELTKNSAIKYLNLGYNQIDHDGTVALAHLHTLTYLDLSHNLQVGSQGTRALAESKSITDLNLAGNQIDYEGAYALGKNPILKRLILSNNLLDNASAIFLSLNTTLRELFLSQNKIGDAGSLALAENTTLKTLNLNYNPIGEKGKDLLKKNSHFSDLSVAVPTPVDFASDIQIKAIFLLAQDYLCIMGYDGSIEFFNPSFARMLGYLDDELLSQPIIKFLHPGDMETGKEYLSRSAKSHLGYENRYLCKDGSCRIIRWTSQIKYNRIYAVGSDMTEIIRSERELEKAQRHSIEVRLDESKMFAQQQVEFISQLCHEVRNPLGGIFGSTEIIEDNLQSLQGLVAKNSDHIGQPLTAAIDQNTQSTNSALKDIKACIEHQKMVLDENLDLSKIIEKKITFKKTSCELKKIILESAAIFSAAAEKKGINLSIKMPENNIFATTDAARVKQIVINLISNAVKFTEKGDVTIILSVTEETSRTIGVKIEVKDTGIGLTKEEIAPLFQRFSKVSAGDYGGSGLGLYISKELIQLMGGTINVTSEKGKGTTFECIVLFDKPFSPGKTLETKPLAPVEKTQPESSISFFQAPHLQASPAQEQPKEESLTPVRERNILIVEDNAVNRKILESHLKKAGYRCVLANDGVEALELYDKQSFDIILTDMVMPRMDGITFIKEIRQRELTKNIPRTPIIAVTANALEQDRAKTLAQGADDYMSKPFSKEEIYAKVKGCLKDTSGQMTNEPAGKTIP